jgi:hypothetical protein
MCDFLKERGLVPMDYTTAAGDVGITVGSSVSRPIKGGYWLIEKVVHVFGAALAPEHHGLVSVRDVTPVPAHPRGSATLDEEEYKAHLRTAGG